jgi:hypothetical protein
MVSYFYFSFFSFVTWFFGSIFINKIESHSFFKKFLFLLKYFILIRLFDEKLIYINVTTKIALYLVIKNKKRNYFHILIDPCP